MATVGLSADAWLRRFHPKSAAGDVVVCFPHAGGSASYYFPFSAAMPPDVDMLTIQYPGRQERRAEPPVESVPELADQIAELLAGWADSRLTFFGHSMGATVAFEVARRLEAGGIAVHGLFASGRRAPSTHRVEGLHLGSDAALIAELRDLSGMPVELLADPEVVQLILPVLRNDLRIAETYRYEPDGSELRCPIVALVGDQDPKVEVAEAAAWQRHTTGTFELRTFSGGHFFLVEHKAAVVEAVTKHAVARNF
ncbi:MAG: thioesterase [Hamadaea sp.]|uniref:thioesterase II family protein n=1 Tax=Hamadaea sp. TaxID=2024425 RepID=UPI0017DDDFCE|nr:alpha/beta fold hydrolase [Hamadaea sp.]NUR69264.1 thioesterase [Hamadaea sp.]NUT22032.1 thioesterase [Hamadaea sp.]